MKKLFLAFLLCITAVPNVFAANWWEHDKVCRISTSTCYPSMGIGYDAEMWDVSGSCYGMKIVCPEALTTGDKDPTLLSKAEISRGDKISKDFDVNTLSTDGCFGTRKTSASGALVFISGNWENVWCRGILNHVDEVVDTGEITLGAQPTCDSLAANGYVAVLNGKCYGKFYNPSEYYIECGNTVEPSRLIILNGADYTATASAGTPEKMSDANTKFKSMYDVSKTQREKYFKQSK